jgi:hypothetical protein
MLAHVVERPEHRRKHLRHLTTIRACLTVASKAVAPIAGTYVVGAIPG